MPIDNNILIIPPSQFGANYDNLVTNAHGVPIGANDPKTALATALGYSDKDTIGPALDQITELAQSLNIGIQIQRTGKAGDPVQVQLDSLDPANPQVPVIKNLLSLLEAALAKGQIGGTNIAGSVATEVKGNPWMSGSVYVSFLLEFMEMMRVLKANKVVEGQVEVASLQMIVQIAKDTAAIHMRLAEIEQINHITAAVCAGISAGIALGSMKVSAQYATSVSSIGKGLTDAASNAVAAAHDLEKGSLEGLKESLQASRTLAQHQMEKATEAFKTDTDLIAKLLETLDSIRKNLQAAVEASLRK